MAIYTAVDEDYDVEAFTSFEALWERARNYDWMDRDESVSVSREALLNQLKKEGEARLFEHGSKGNWTLKVNMHRN